MIFLNARARVSIFIKIIFVLRVLIRLINILCEENRE